MGKRRLVVLSEDGGEEILEFCPEGESKSIARPASGNSPSWSLDVVPSINSIPSQIARMTTFDQIYGDTPIKLIPFDGLHLHRKKLEELQIWFEDFVKRVAQNEPSILLVSGPSGCGKSSSVYSLCQKYNLRPLDGYEVMDHKIKKTNLKVVRSKSKPLNLYPSLNFSKEGMEGEEEEKEESLAPKAMDKVIIFEDLPNESSNLIIENILSDFPLGRLQIILIVTDPCNYKAVKDDQLLRRVLQMQLTQHVTFNSIAPSIMRKICKFNGISSHKAILDSGDARAAFVDCIFSNLSSDINNPFLERDSSWGFFHSVGKLLYPRKEKDPVDPSMITEPDRDKFHSFLHANYPKHLRSIKNIEIISDVFSWVDSANYICRLDFNWDQFYSCLPERYISSLVQTDGVTNKKFTPLEAPSIVTNYGTIKRLSKYNFYNS